MERIICDIYEGKKKRIWRLEDINSPFNVRVIAVNDMYGWLYKNGILEKVAFAMDMVGDDVFFGLDTKDLEPYKEAMASSGLKNADIAIRHIFNENYSPCVYSGAIQPGWTMLTYRDCFGVSRSWEVELVKELKNEYAFKTREIRETDGVKAAVQYLFSF